MKALSLAALMLAFAVPASAGPLIVDGCEMRPMPNGNYFVKVDPTCEFERVGMDERGAGRPEPTAPPVTPAE